MTDIAKSTHRPDPGAAKISREAFRETANLFGLGGFVLAAAVTGSLIPIALAVVLEAAYLAAMPMVPAYRQLVSQRERERILKLNRSNRERLVRGFTPREREAVEYLRWQKDKIQENYVKFTGARELPSNLRSLEQRWEDFVDLLDTYRRRKQHLASIDSNALHNQLSQAFREAESEKDDKTKRVLQTNVEILKRRLLSYEELEKSVKLVEGQLQAIENFFGYLNDEVVTMSTPEKFSLLDFEQLSDSIAMTKQMLDETAESVGALDSFNREMGNYELLPGANK
jgi:hypothetical protein